MKNARGFTLIELMVTLGVLAVLVSIAAPSFNTMIQNNRMTTRANDLVTALQLARSEAIKRGTAVTVTATGGNWNSGWTVATGGTDLRVYPAAAGTITFTETGGRTTISYQSNGIASNGPLTMNVCDSGRTGETGRQITVLLSGRVSMANFICG